MAISRHARIGLVAGVVLIAAALLSRHGREQSAASPASSVEIHPPSARAGRAERLDKPNAQEKTPVAADPAAADRVSELLRATLEGFRGNPDPAAARTLLLKLREGVRQAPEVDAAAALVAFLRSGEDAPSGLPFVVGEDGMMETVPTLRTALLDLLPSLDPEAALEIARDVMDRRTSPDEYALGLRNVAWNDLDGDLHGELARRFSDLLDSPWLDQPTAGVLESFDLAVELGGGELFDRMVTVAEGAMQKTNLGVSRAAFMSLDRLVLRDPELLVSAFSRDVGWMDFAPEQRASLMARLDLENPGQRELFVRYLAVPHGAGELDYFSRLFPNGNFLYGHRLVTTPETTPTLAEISASDARVLAKLDAIEAGAPEPAKTALQTIRERLLSAAPSPKLPK